jgi:hypothetical protein
LVAVAISDLMVPRVTLDGVVVAGVAIGQRFADFHQVSTKHSTKPVHKPVDKR